MEMFWFNAAASVEFFSLSFEINKFNNKNAAKILHSKIVYPEKAARI